MLSEPIQTGMAYRTRSGAKARIYSASGGHGGRPIVFIGHVGIRQVRWRPDGSNASSQAVASGDPLDIVAEWVEDAEPPTVTPKESGTYRCRNGRHADVYVLHDRQFLFGMVAGEYQEWELDGTVRGTCGKRGTDIVAIVSLGKFGVPKPLQIRVGRWYQLRNGDQVQIDVLDPATRQAIGYYKGQRVHWCCSGRINPETESPADIIGEVIGRSCGELPVDDRTHTEPTCATCRFWDGELKFGMLGDRSLCRKTSPTTSQSNDAKWPVTSVNDWCGEHEQKPEGDHGPLPGNCQKHGKFTSLQCPDCVAELEMSKAESVPLPTEPVTYDPGSPCTCLSCGRGVKPGRPGNSPCPYCNERLDGQGSCLKTGLPTAATKPPAPPQPPTASDGNRCSDCGAELRPVLVGKALVCQKCCARLC